jgi:hypothetical protein
MKYRLLGPAGERQQVEDGDADEQLHGEDGRVRLQAGQVDLLQVHPEQRVELAEGGEDADHQGRRHEQDQAEAELGLLHLAEHAEEDAEGGAAAGEAEQLPVGRRPLRGGDGEQGAAGGAKQDAGVHQAGALQQQEEEEGEPLAANLDALLQFADGGEHQADGQAAEGTRGDDADLLPVPGVRRDVQQQAEVDALEDVFHLPAHGEGP